MLHALATFVLAAEAHGASKVPFYLGGGVLAGWAVLVGFIGLRSDGFPDNERGARTVMSITVLLVAIAMATAVITS